MKPARGGSLGYNFVVLHLFFKAVCLLSSRLPNLFLGYFLKADAAVGVCKNGCPEVCLISAGVEQFWCPRDGYCRMLSWKLIHKGVPHKLHTGARCPNELYHFQEIL